jgi:peptidoglycan/xylan/chitin deacetylase (PgdA/CDA1 family)
MRIPIFYYHSIGGIPPETLPLPRFIQHLEALTRLNFKTVTFSALLKGKYHPEEKVAVLTFDDGLLDNYELALPELVKRHMTATFFIAPGYYAQTRWVNPRTRRWSDEPREGYNLARPCLNARHIAELARLGMEIACHSFTHRKLTTISHDELNQEIVGAKKVLEDNIGQAVETFCYPRGGYNREIISFVRAAGYLGAASTWPGYYQPHRNRFQCRRFLIEDPKYFTEILKDRAFAPAPLLRILLKNFAKLK